MLSTYPTLLRQQLWRKVAKLLRQDAFGCTAKKVGSALTLTRLSCLIPTRFRTRITTVCNRVVSSWRRWLSYVPTPLGCKVRPSVSLIMEFFWESSHCLYLVLYTQETSHFYWQWFHILKNKLKLKYKREKKSHEPFQSYLLTGQA